MRKLKKKIKEYKHLLICNKKRLTNEVCGDMM